MSKHTPGPWRVHGDFDRYERTSVEGDDNMLVAEADCYDRPQEVLEANARLIAAAVDMLEALEAIVADAEYLALVGNNHARRMKAKAAIAKAKGEEE